MGKMHIILKALAKMSIRPSRYLYISPNDNLEAMQIAIRGKNDPEWGRQLQIADFVAWSTYQKYAKGEAQIFDVIKDKVKAELELGVDGSGIMRPISEMNNTKGWE